MPYDDPRVDQKVLNAEAEAKRLATALSVYCANSEKLTGLLARNPDAIMFARGLVRKLTACSKQERLHQEGK